jgi:hypothetical protein
MHLTCESPGTAEAYRQTGKFADGTVLVKEVFGSEHAQMTTGDANWASETKVWFVLIKDEKGRYAGNPLWGDGWGWALSKADSPDKQVAVDYKKDCLGYHIPAKSNDTKHNSNSTEAPLIITGFTRITRFLQNPPFHHRCISSFPFVFRRLRAVRSLLLQR